MKNAALDDVPDCQLYAWIYEGIVVTSPGYHLGQMPFDSKKVICFKSLACQVFRKNDETRLSYKVAT